MSKRSYLLTKTKITSGLQCKKKLWFDIHQPNENEDSFLFHSGNRFGEVIKKYYGQGLDLTDIKKDYLKAIELTNEAINSKDCKVIYEAAFLYHDTLVRTDVLIRDNESWNLLEAKSSTKLKSEHIPDIAIQAFIARSRILNLSKIKLIHMNSDFIYEGNNNYKNLIKEVDITEEIIAEEDKVQNYIKDFKKLTSIKSSSPEISMGEQCKKPHICIYQEKCRSLLPKTKKVSYEILPNKTKKLQNYCIENKIVHLEDIPQDIFVNNIHKVIQASHKNNKEWINVDLKMIMEKYIWPFYFMDFETINQGVPIIKGTGPYSSLPFQWSVHEWQHIDQEIKLEEGKSFLNFDNQDIERKFVETLIEAVGSKGTIFAHNAPTEISVLKKLRDKDSCKDLASKINAIIDRIEDTLPLVRNNFYHPIMKGEYGIKKIIKSIPSSVNYEEENNIEGGMGAQLAWFVCTDPNTTNEEKEMQKKLLIEYCAKDTLAIYFLIKYLLKKSNIKKL